MPPIKEKTSSLCAFAIISSCFLTFSAERIAIGLKCSVAKFATFSIDSKSLPKLAINGAKCMYSDGSKSAFAVSKANSILARCSGSTSGPKPLIIPFALEIINPVSAALIADLGNRLEATASLTP